MPFAAKDLKPLMIFSSSGLAFGVGSSVDAKTLPDVISQGKAQPFTFASAGNGEPGPHRRRRSSRTRPARRSRTCPTRAKRRPVTALLSGEVQAGILATPGLLPQLQAGKLSGAGRHAAASARRCCRRWPPWASSAVKDLEVRGRSTSRWCLAATPEPVMQTLRGALADRTGLAGAQEPPGGRWTWWRWAKPAPPRSSTWTPAARATAGSSRPPA